MVLPWAAIINSVDDNKDKTAANFGSGAEAYYNNKMTKAELKEYLEGLKAQNADIANRGAETSQMYQDAYGNLVSNYDDTAKGYFDYLNNYDPNQFNVSTPKEEFSYDLIGKTNEFMNPELDAIIGRASDTVQQSAANNGNLFSGATGKAITRSASDITAQEYDKARQAAQQDKQSAYQQYTDKFNQALQVAQQNANNYQSGMTAKTNLFNAQSGINDKLLQGKVDTKNAVDEAQLQNETNQIEANAKAAGTTSGLRAFGQGFLGSFASVGK